MKAGHEYKIISIGMLDRIWLTSQMVRWKLRRSRGPTKRSELVFRMSISHACEKTFAPAGECGGIGASLYNDYRRPDTTWSAQLDASSHYFNGGRPFAAPQLPPSCCGSLHSCTCHCARILPIECHQQGSCPYPHASRCDSSVRNML